jgi:hypothetical protein
MELDKRTGKKEKSHKGHNRDDDLHKIEDRSEKDNEDDAKTDDEDENYETMMNNASKDILDLNLVKDITL